MSHPATARDSFRISPYKDDDKTDEVLSYIINAEGKIACTVRGIPGLPATEFWSCKDSDPGEDIHERVVLEEF